MRSKGDFWGWTISGSSTVFAFADRRISRTGRWHCLDGPLLPETWSRSVPELGNGQSAYISLTMKFVEHFLMIASGMIRPGEEFGMWDEQDGFFYDVLRLPDGRAERLKVRSMVGLLPFCAVTIFERKIATNYPEVGATCAGISRRPGADGFIHDLTKPGYKERILDRF